MYFNISIQQSNIPNILAFKNPKSTQFDPRCRVIISSVPCQLTCLNIFPFVYKYKLSMATIGSARQTPTGCAQQTNASHVLPRDLVSSHICVCCNAVKLFTCFSFFLCLYRRERHYRNQVPYLCWQRARILSFGHGY